MVLAEKELFRAADEILERALVRERRRVTRRTIFATLRRIALGLLVFWGVGLVASLIVDVTIPWVFFGVLTFLGTTLGALMSFDDDAPRQEANEPRGRFQDNSALPPPLAQPATTHGVRARESVLVSHR